MPVLEGDCIDHVVYAVEDFVPLALVLLHAHSVLHLGVGAHYGLLAVYPRRNEGRQASGDILALLAHRVEGLHRPYRVAADFRAYVPASEAAVLFAVHLPHLVDDELVVLDFVAHVLRVPIDSRIVEAEVEFHVIFLRQAAEHVDEVHRRHIAAFLQQVRGWVGDELAVAASYVYDRVYAYGFHIGEIAVPFLFAPVLVRDVVGNLIQEGSGNAESVLLRDNQGALQPVVLSGGAFFVSAHRAQQ